MSRRSHRGGRPHPGGARPGRPDAPRPGTPGTGPEHHAAGRDDQAAPLRRDTSTDATATQAGRAQPAAPLRVSVESVDLSVTDAGIEMVVESLDVAILQADPAEAGPGGASGAAGGQAGQAPRGVGAPDVAGIAGGARLRQPAATGPGQRPRQPGGLLRGPGPRPPDRRPVDGARPTGGPAAPADEPVEAATGAGRSGCTAPQLKRFIKSRVYVPMHELRRRFQIEGHDDDVTAVVLATERVYLGLPEREGRLLGELLRAGDVGYELSMDPPTPIVVGVYPMRPIPRG